MRYIFRALFGFFLILPVGAQAEKEPGGVCSTLLTSQLSENNPKSALAQEADQCVEDLVQKGRLESAFFAILSLASTGEPKSMYALGLALISPSFPNYAGIEEDQRVALGTSWIVRSAASGHLQAINRIARMFETGMSVKPDKATADCWKQALADASLLRKCEKMTKIDSLRR
jgi:hypothetical protein